MNRDYTAAGPDSMTFLCTIDLYNIKLCFKRKIKSEEIHSDKKKYKFFFLIPLSHTFLSVKSREERTCGLLFFPFEVVYFPGIME